MASRLQSCSQISLSAQLPLIPHLIKGGVMAGRPQAARSSGRPAPPSAAEEPLYMEMSPRRSGPAEPSRLLTGSRTNHPGCSDGNLARTIPQLNTDEPASIFWLCWAINYASRAEWILAQILTRCQCSWWFTPGCAALQEEEDEAGKQPASAERLLMLWICVDWW